MVDALVATTTSIPWMTDMTQIRVVVDRIMPSSVRKLRSLLPRSESIATIAASKNDARSFAGGGPDLRFLILTRTIISVGYVVCQGVGMNKE